jgi:hypothetical protein
MSKPNWIRQLKNKPFFDVREYGAKGDDSTDDTPSLQLAIDAAVSAGGGVVFFPKGTYRISSALAFNSSNITLEGTGSGSVIKQLTANTDALTVGAALSYNYHNTVRNLKLLSNTPSTSTSGWAIRIYGARRLKIENVIIDYFHSGIKATDSTSYFTIESCYLLHCGGADTQVSRDASRGIYLDAQTKVEILNTKIYPDGGIGDSVGSNLPYAAIECIQCGGLNIDSETDTYNHKIGLILSPVDNGATPRVIEYGSISGTFDTNSEYAIEIAPTGSSIVHAMKFPNAWACNSGSVGVRIYPTGTATVEDLAFAGGRFFQNATNSFRIERGAVGVSLRNISIVDCDLRGFASATIQTAAIWVGAGVTHVDVSCNRIGDSVVFPTDPAIGVHLASGASDYITIEGNRFYGTTQPIKNESTGQRINISDNLGVDDIWSTLSAGGAALTLPDTCLSNLAISGGPYTTMTPVWNSRKVTLYNASGVAVTLNTGGTAGQGFSRAVTIANGESYDYEFMDGFWWPKG